MADNPRYFSAADRRISEAKTLGDLPVKDVSVMQINDAVRHLANTIEQHVPDGRNKFIALTELESVQMRANRGVYAPEEYR